MPDKRKKSETDVAVLRSRDKLPQVLTRFEANIASDQLTVHSYYSSQIWET